MKPLYLWKKQGDLITEKHWNDLVDAVEELRREREKADAGGAVALAVTAAAASGSQKRVTRRTLFGLKRKP